VVHHPWARLIVHPSIIDPSAGVWAVTAGHTTSRGIPHAHILERGLIVAHAPMPEHLVGERALLAAAAALLARR
jgi:hypothetical protein